MRQVNHLASALGAAALLLAGCVLGSAPPPPMATPAAAAVNFVAFGDAGSGSPAQFAVGKAMAEVCAVRGCGFALMLGDNFYPSGVSSADDPQFVEKFEKPYEGLSIPFFVALGNHDNGSNAAQNHRGDFEVDYARRTDRISDKWRMPARYYRFTAPLDSPTPLAEFFALDSSPLAPYNDDPDPKWNAETYGAEQLGWLQGALKESRTPWRIVFAHHPYLSNGGHGSAGRYLNRATTSVHASGRLYKRFVEGSVCSGNVDLMLQGHDHDLEWIKPTPACGKTQFITSGAGGASVTPFSGFREPTYWESEKRYGFFWISLEENQLSAAAYTLNAELALPRDAEGRIKPAFEQTQRREDPVGEGKPLLTAE
jgi:hypothetical protein